ncbi:MAG: PIN domain-containing protein [Alphaproteobacteria bacterium]|nr:PIN domain-containing protein [Alphaproteobacteria bacterium]
MRVLIDACVLYPTVLREIVLEVARTGAFTPLWSPRILEEWARAAARIDPAQEVIARGEIALLTARWPDAHVTPSSETEARLWLPDTDDIHVLAAAIDGHADALMTLNIRDFPTRVLSAEGILRRDPDGFLLEAWHADPEGITACVARVVAEAERLSGQPLNQRALLKRARLPRLGKALD